MSAPFSSHRRSLGFIPAPAVLLGAFVMQQHEIKAAVWGQNVGVWLIASTLIFALGGRARMGLPISGRFGLPIALALVAFVALPFCFSGLNGVHRWIELGGIRIQAAAIALPAFLAGNRTLEKEVGSRIVGLLSLILGGLLLLQPDAAQATGFGLAIITLTLVKRTRRKPQKGCTIVLICGLSIVATWNRADPLEAVPHVELILQMALGLSPILAAVAGASLLLTALPFFVALRHHDDGQARATALALGGYYVGVLLATLSGRFPVPLLGYGASPIIGYFIALGWLIQTQRKRPLAPEC